MNDNLYGAQILNEHECGSFKRNSSVAPFSLFISFFYFFVASLALSIYDSFVLLGSFVCPSLGSFVLSSLGYFPHFKGNTLYFISIEDLHTLQEVLNIKRMKLS